jgi:hypothetical protein
MVKEYRPLKRGIQVYAVMVRWCLSERLLDVSELVAGTGEDSQNRENRFTVNVTTLS